MEILTIQSKHSLTAAITTRRPEGDHSYIINARQFGPAYKIWKQISAPHGVPLALMTLGFERIWLTEPEIVQVAAAIRATQPALSLD